MYCKMSYLVSFTFNTAEFQTVAVNGKPWTCAREVCRALGYREKSETLTIIKQHSSQENYVDKYQMRTVHVKCTHMHRSKLHKKYNLYNSEKGMYEFLFPGQEPKTKDFWKYCCT